MITKWKTEDVIGACCGIFVLCVLIITMITSAIGVTVGAKPGDIPASALTLTGTAPGRNGDVTVQVVADSRQIYSIKVLQHKETDGIGTVAVDKTPLSIYQAQSLDVDVPSGATITAGAIKAAIADALRSGGIDPAIFGGGELSQNYGIKAERLATTVETGSGVVLITAAQWSEQYPAIYESYMRNAENDQTNDLTEQYPMIPTLFEGYGFAKYYTGARGHTYVIEDLTATGRPHKLANCFTCKTPDFTKLAVAQGDAAYSLAFEDVLQDVNEPLSCYNCHGNTPGKPVVTHTYLSDAMGDDLANVDHSTLACGQCHVDYYFAADTKATTLPYSSLSTMTPDAMLEYYNTLIVDGEVFADYVNPSNGVRQIMINHPEMETFLGEGSVHKGDFTCADCHMGTGVDAEGQSYPDHYLRSPLQNEELIAATCAECHTGDKDLHVLVPAIQEAMEQRTYDIGYELEELLNAITEAVNSGKYTDDQLDAIRMSYRNAQYYWNFVFVENSEGAHNSSLDNACLDKSEALIKETWELLD